MTDLLESIRRQLHERVAELQPYVDEYERLTKAERALSAGSGTTTNGPVATELRRPSRRVPKRRASTARDRAANRERVLAVISERPGLSRAELIDSTGLSAGAVAQNLRRLIASADVSAEPRADGQTGHRLVADG